MTGHDAADGPAAPGTSRSPGVEVAAPERSSALFTDHYELTMVEGALRSGVASHRCVFEVFARSLPPGRRYGVVAGLHRLLPAIEAFRFGPGELEMLERGGWLSGDTLDFLAHYRFRGSVDAYGDGELFFPFSPVLSVEGTFAEAVMLETLVLSVLNHDSAIASAAARMVGAAGERQLVEMGGRRTHEEAAVAAARAAYLVGFSSTANLEAGRRHGIPTTGTAAHAFVLAHRDEPAAFAAQVATLGPSTTLLVDTYGLDEGIRHAVSAAGPKLGAIRIDSGDLGSASRRARALLDELGATSTRIVISGDLDEYAIEELASAPIDAYGVGTKVVDGSGAPSANLIYKLVAVADQPGDRAPLRAVAKRSPAKATIGGRKTALRILDPDGTATEELVLTEGSDPGGTGDAAGALSGSRKEPAASHRALQSRVMESGSTGWLPSLEADRKFHRRVLRELAPQCRLLLAGAPALTAVHQ